MNCPGHGYNKDYFHANPADCPEAKCGHTEVYPNGYCADCGEPIEDFEPSDAQIPGSYEIGKAVA